MNCKDIRNAFLTHFRKEGHTLLDSAPVVPHNDPTLLFNNAGMNQFKDVFLGKVPPKYPIVATSQKCIRAGGKHNDLDQVGHTSRHLTFFEMLGNFSFGDYFKEKAIEHAWILMTEIFKLEKDKLWASVFETDDESYELWKKHLPQERIVRLGEKDNFWAMGPVGPCGPCSEILYDRGSDYGSAPSPAEDISGERYLELWNLVFMESNRAEDGSLSPLPKKCIDTGAGLERLAMILNDVDDVYDTDVLQALIKQIEVISGFKYQHDSENGAAFRVIADHIRCLSFAIADGAQPSNTERGYVLRKILRRAVRYGRQLGLMEPFLAQLLPTLINHMSDPYSQLKESKKQIEELLNLEETAFIRTLNRGKNLLDKVILNSKESGQISGEDAFKLKDTYGLPFEEMELIATDNSLTIDKKLYEKLIEQARDLSKKAHQQVKQSVDTSIFDSFTSLCEFVGFTSQQAKASIQAIIVNNKFTQTLEQGQEAMILVNRSPFYAEKGGQIGDHGVIQKDQNTFTVTDCITPKEGIICHTGQLESGSLSVGDSVILQVNSQERAATEGNHSATHLLHYALKKVLGDHIKQAGSLVDIDRLRFDFNHHKGLSDQEIESVEQIVNAWVRQNVPVKTYEISYEEAQKQPDIQQFFGEKYGATVRVVDIHPSRELCGGTHVDTTGNIGLFKIIKESSIASGVRRIEALTGNEAEVWVTNQLKRLNALSSMLSVANDKIEEGVSKLQKERQSYKQELKQEQKKSLQSTVDQLLNSKESIQGIEIISGSVALSAELFKELCTKLDQNLSDGILILANTTASDKCSLIVCMQQDAIDKKLSAGALVKEVAPLFEGKGGGKAQRAQAGGVKPEGLEMAIATARTLIQEKLR